jgi:hypothetical protein
VDKERWRVKLSSRKIDFVGRRVPTIFYVKRAKKRTRIALLNSYSKQSKIASLAPVYPKNDAKLL